MFYVILIKRKYRLFEKDNRPFNLICNRLCNREIGHELIYLCTIKSVKKYICQADVFYLNAPVSIKYNFEIDARNVQFGRRTKTK